jgi:SSS family solute:Na+ symporter
LGFQTDSWGAGIILIVIVTTAAWILVTFLTPPDENAKLLAFYRKVRPGGFWGPIARLSGSKFKLQVYPFIGWGLAVLMILFLLFGIGRLIFMSWLQGLVYLSAGGISALLLSRIIRKIDWN